MNKYSVGELGGNKIFSWLPLTVKIKIVKESHNTLNQQSRKIFNRKNFPSYCTVHAHVHLEIYMSKVFGHENFVQKPFVSRRPPTKLILHEMLFSV